MPFQFMRAVADIGCLYQPVGLERVLNAKVPLLRVGGTPVGIRAVNPWESRKRKGVSRNTLTGKLRVRAPAERVLDIVSWNRTGIEQGCRAIEERRDHVLRHVPIQIVGKMIDSITTPNHSVLDIPGEAN